MCKVLYLCGDTMAAQKILAEEVVSVSEMRKHPMDFFADHLVAVLNNNQVAGYMVGRDLFETMYSMIAQIQNQGEFPARFHPSSTQLRKLVEGSTKYLESAQEKDLGTFVE